MNVVKVYPDASTEELLEYVHAQAKDLCELANDMGIVVTIERRAITPLAMGHAEYDIAVREKRHPVIKGEPR